MPHGLRGERTLMRVHIGESDKHQGRPLYQVIVETLRERGFAGATVLRGIMGFGSESKVVHSDRILRLSLDLPIVVEVVDEEEKIQGILPILDEMVSGGLITMERVSVVLYRPHGASVSSTPGKA
jgi:PII-like signaling protein